ncbi:GGDEF domain-containing protein [Christensenellaceae bacterium OttesenSCG-928-K19]|nr:GGDEF domain-containing protein [Christensenellaceae bacterium OttesenSCG-928-K19]
MGVYVKNTFEEEQRRIHGLLKSEEDTNKKLEELTNRDPLTGTYNRRFLSNFLEVKLQPEIQPPKDLCVMALDIDHFKQINDTWGHGFGDEALVRFTTAIQDNLRKDDILARLGGEEFIVVLNQIEFPKAKEIAERIRKAVSEITFHNGARMTVSIGLVQAEPGEGEDDVLKRADKCLYHAKNAGRNRVVSNP